MIKIKPGNIIAFAMTVAMTLAAANPVLAAKKLTYEQAWARCKALLDKESAPGTTTAGNWRMVRGGACMKHYGYSL